jgi:hypothetical protein
MAHRGQPRSIVWRLSKVKEDDATKVVCNICNKVLSRGGKSERFFSTTNMKKHLISQHKEKYEDEERLAIEEAVAAGRDKRTIINFVTVNPPAKRIRHELDGTSAPSASTSGSSSLVDSSLTQQTLEETLGLKKIFDINSPQAQKIHYAIGEMIALDTQPFSIVEDIGFKRLMHLVKPSYQLPSRKYFTTNIIPDMHTKIMAKIHQTVNRATNMSFTTDIWTNNSDASFIR